MNKLLGKKRLLTAKVQRLAGQVETDSAQQWNIATARIYEQESGELWNEFNAIFDELFSLCKPEDEANYVVEYNDLANILHDMKVIIQSTLVELEQPIPISESRQQNQNQVRCEISAKLPKLDPPKFSGNVLEWTTFRDLFASSVHNHPTLAGAEKLKYLKTSLTGEASELLESFPISDANYEEAWATLEKRYQNTRKLIKAHLLKIIQLSSMKNESGVELRKIVDTMSSVSRALKALKRPIDDDCDLAMLLITELLDPDTKKLWKTHIGREKLPKLSELLGFLDDRAAVLRSSESDNVYKMNPGGATAATTKNTAVAHAHQISLASTCIVCNNGNHPIYCCDTFNNASVADRKALAYRHNLCLNCLRPGHAASKCFSESSCKRCGHRHHTLLHLDDDSNDTNVQTETASVHTSVHDSDANRALLPTAVVGIQDEFNQVHSFRALIDPGADVSFVSQRCADLLGLPKQKAKINFTGLGACAVGASQERVRMTLYSRFDGDAKVIDVDTYIIKSVTGTLPKLPCNPTEVSHMKHLPLADPTFDQPGEVDLLLGSDVYFHTLKSGLVNISQTRPVAQETSFGWIVGGTCPSQNFTSAASVNHTRFESLQKTNSKPRHYRSTIRSVKSSHPVSISATVMNKRPNRNTTEAQPTFQLRKWKESNERMKKCSWLYKDEYGDICRSSAIAS